MAEILSKNTTVNGNIVIAKDDNYVDMNQQEIKHIVIHKVTNSTMPSAPVNGQMVYNTEKNKFGQYQNNTWVWTEKMPDIIGASYRLLTVNGAGDALVYREITGESGHCTVTHTSDAITITLPQQIMTTSDVQFNTVTLATQTNPADNEAVTKAYLNTRLDEREAGIKVRTTCACATTGNITSLSGLISIDEYQLQVGDRVLVKNQNNAYQNGIYVAGTSAWSRATDFNTWSEYVDSHTYVEYGTVNSDCGYVCDAVAGGTLNSTPINYTIFSKIGRIDPGNGISKSGNTISVNADTDTLKFEGGELAVNLYSNGGLVGNANGIGLNIDTNSFAIVNNELQLVAAPSGVVEQTISIPALTKNVATPINHTLGKKPKSIRFYKTATGDTAIPEITGITNSSVTVKFSRATATDEFSVDLMAGA